MDRAAYEKRKAANDDMLRVLAVWLEADASARLQQGSFGTQLIEVFWEDGRIVGAELRPTHVLKPGRLGLEGGGNAGERVRRDG